MEKRKVLTVKDLRKKLDEFEENYYLLEEQMGKFEDTPVLAEYFDFVENRDGFENSVYSYKGFGDAEIHFDVTLGVVITSKI